MRVWYLLILLLLVPAAGIKIAAVDNNRHGVLVDGEVEVIPGKGRLLITSEPFTGIDTQYSGRTALDVSLNYTNQDLGARDVVYTFHANATFIEGGSAGAAMTIETISALENRRVREDFVISGGIGPGGEVLEVGSILEKVYPAREYSFYLIPKGQSLIEATVPIVREDDGKLIRTDEHIVIDLNDYAKHHWDIEVIEVEKIGEAVDFAWGSEEPKVEQKYNFSFEPREIAPAEEPLVNTVYKFSEEANAIIQLLPQSEAKDGIIENLQKSEEYLELGYPYSAANKTFRALIDARVLRDAEQDIGVIRERVYSKLDEFEVPRGYQEPVHLLIAGRERYSWALTQRMITEISEVEDLESLEAMDAWLDISAELLSYVQGEGKTFSIGLASLAERNLEEAKEEVAADFILNEDPYASTLILNSAEYDRSQGWYYESVYDSINSKARAYCIGGESEVSETAKRYIQQGENFVSKAEEKGMGFWARQYLGEAKIAFVENSTRDACAFGMMAGEYAKADLEIAGYRMEVIEKENVQVEESVAVETQGFLKFLQNIIEFFGRQ